MIARGCPKELRIREPSESRRWPKEGTSRGESSVVVRRKAGGINDRLVASLQAGASNVGKKMKRKDRLRHKNGGRSTGRE